MQLARDTILRDTLRNPWLWLIAVGLVLFATRADASPRVTLGDATFATSTLHPWAGAVHVGGYAHNDHARSDAA